MNIQIELIFGVLSTCLSIIIHFSKIKDSILSYRAKAKYTSIPAHLRIENILRYFVCSSWLMYSSYLKDKYILISNVIGFIFFWFWLILIFFLYFRKINFIKYFMFLLLSILFVPGIYFMLYFSLYFGGKICAVIYAISYFGVILEIKEIIKTKDFRIIKIRVCILRLLEDFCWFIYGFIMVNVNIIVPHVIGFIIIFISAFFWNIYKKRANPDRLSNRSVDIMRNRAEFSM